MTMQRIYPSNTSYSQNNSDLTKQTAFHEAGHAASIYLGNKEKQLPPVFFQIQINKSSNNYQSYAKVIDGCLIQNIPASSVEDIHNFSKVEQHNYKCAYEADIINLLVGPLAEAKYVSIRDNEVFNSYLLNPRSLYYYGGSSDVEKAYAYLEYLISSKTKREEKITELFLQAFKFIENNENWKSILNLANYILNSNKDILSCEETIEVLQKNNL